MVQINTGLLVNLKLGSFPPPLFSQTNFPMASQFFTKIESRFVTSADGTQILADAIGNRSPEFPVIVMIHGFCMIGAAFDPMFDDSQWTSNAFLVCFSPMIKFDLY